MKDYQITGNLKLGTIVIDTKTNEEWEYLGWTYSQSNYSCAKIKNPKTGIIRKLSVFCHDNSTRDIGRYIIKEEK